MFTRKFLVDTAERSVSTFVQAALAVIIVSEGFGADVWKAAAVAGGLAVAKAIGATFVGDKESASLVDGTK